jgi:hypothetical protein
MDITENEKSEEIGRRLIKVKGSNRLSLNYEYGIKLIERVSSETKSLIRE